MKKLLKIFLPPFIGLLIFSVLINYNALNITQKMNQVGLTDITSFTAFYRYTLPLLFLVAVLTQLLVVMPAWRMLRRKTAADRINFIVDLICICVMFSFGISYAIWDTATGVHRLFVLTAFMSGVQAVYWFINLLIMYLID